MKQSALGSVFIFQKRGIGLDNYKGKEFMSRMVEILVQENMRHQVEVAE